MTPGTIVENGAVPTLCRMCSNRCSIVVHIEDGNMVDVRPLAGNPVNQGKMCPRGRACLDVFYHNDRIRKPLKRQSDNTFVEISLEQALNEIARIAKQHDIVAEEVLAVLEVDRPQESVVRSSGILARVLAYLGGILVLAGIATLVILPALIHLFEKWLFRTDEQSITARADA